uniref:Uncharacterized protein n=1 Tax=Amphimedon queenslandica TaxID=400682 RepID=A0A1X7TBN7_AMPQE
MIPSILPSHNNTQYTCIIMIETNPSDCSTQAQVITFRVKATFISSVAVVTNPVVSFINSTVVLTCTISLNTGIGPDTSFISHYWYQYSTDISNRSTPLMISGDSKSLVTTTLNITSVQLLDARVYQCGASIDANDTVINNTAYVCVKVPVINISFDADLRLGDVREYDCTLGYGHSGVEIIASWAEYTSGRAVTNPLILTVDQSINNTVYTCSLLIIRNPVYCPFQQVNVSFTVKDTFVMTVMTNTVHLILSNAFQQLECHITTNTDINTTNTDINSIVKVSWYRDNGNENRLVSDSEAVSTLPIVSVTNTSFNSTLRFSPITSSTPVSTFGNYTCVAWIGEHSVRNMTSNNVQVMMKIPNDKVPVINLIPHQSVYDTGGDITLSCSVTYPYTNVKTYLTLQWFNSSNHTLNSSTIINDYNEHTLTYTISNARLSDAGQYTCSFFVITSLSDIVISNSTKNFITINITIPNVIVPYILVHPSKLYYNVNDSITLSCIIHYPTNHLIDVDTTVTIQWLNYSLKSYQYIKLSDYSEHSFNYTVSSLKLTDAGQYTCSFFINATRSANIIRSKTNYNFTSITVKIPNGENPLVTQLKPYYRVGDNIDLICSATYPSYITSNLNIQWLNSSNHTLHSYTGINNNTEHTISYTINNVSLSDAGQYTCQYNISCTNRSFVLPSDNMRTSTIVSIKTISTIKSPKLIAISSSSLILSWSPPTTHQSIPIIGYNYTCIGINVSYTMTGSVSNTSLSVTLLGLIPFREYTCNVTAITRYGRGISANVSTVTDEA